MSKQKNAVYKSMRLDLDQKDTVLPDSPRRKMKEKNIRNLVKRSFNYTRETQSFFRDKSVRNSTSSPLSVRFGTEGDTQENLYTVTETERLDTYAQTYGSFLMESSKAEKFVSPKAEKFGSFKSSFLTKSPKGLNFALVLSEKNLSSFPKNKHNDYLSLQILDLSQNKFKEIPRELKFFENLKVLKLDNNLIKELPEDMFSWFNALEIFSVANNNLEKFPQALGDSAKSLRSICISENQILEFPTAFNTAERIRSLSVSKTAISIIPKAFFMKFKSTLEDFSLEWFKYLTPPRETSLKGQDLKAFLIEATEGAVPDLINFLEFVKYFSGRHDFTSLLEGKFNKNRTLLHQVACDEDIGALRTMLAVHPGLINVIDKENHTPLSLAIYEEKYYSAKMLIFNGADSNIGGGIVGGCLAMGVLKLQYYLIRDLLKFGADPNKRDKDGNTALHYLFSIFNRETKQGLRILELLLENGINPNLKNNEGWYPIHVAVRRNNTEVLNWICSYNKRKQAEENSDKQLFDLSRKGGKLAQTPLHIASQAGYKDMVQILINAGVPCGQENLEGKTAKMVCAKNLFLLKMLRAEEKKAIKRDILERLVAEEKLETRYDTKTKVFSDEGEDESNEGVDDMNENLDSLTNKMRGLVFTVTGGDRGNERPTKFFNPIEERLFMKKKMGMQLNPKFSDSDSENELEGLEEDENIAAYSKENNQAGIKFEAKKKNLTKNLHITPNNIKKVDRFQRYYHNFTKSAIPTLNPVVSVREKENDRRSGKNKLPNNAQNRTPTDLPCFYKRMIKNVLRIKAKTLELKQEMTTSKLASQKVLENFNILNKMQLKLVCYKMEAHLRKLSPAIFNTNIFESLTQQNFDGNALKEGVEMENNINIVLKTLLEVSRLLPQDDYISLNVKALILHLMAISRFVSASQYLSEIQESPANPQLLRYEAFQSAQALRPLKRRHAN